MIGILIDDNYELIVSNGTLSVGIVDEQVVELTFKTSPGEHKEKPTMGIGIINMLNGSKDPFLKNRIKEQLQLQHITPIVLEVSENEIKIEL